jgi:hypothetical protein
MQVASYQMHNVLECYTKKLSRVRATEESACFPLKKIGEGPALSPESSRMATMDKISQQVLDKVKDVVALSHSPEPLPAPAHGDASAGAGGGQPASEEFTYNVIDAINRKRTARLAMGDPAAPARRLDQMAEQASADATDSWV